MIATIEEFNQLIEKDLRVIFKPEFERLTPVDANGYLELSDFVWTDLLVEYFETYRCVYASYANDNLLKQILEKLPNDYCEKDEVDINEVYEIADNVLAIYALYYITSIWELENPELDMYIEFEKKVELGREEYNAKIELLRQEREQREREQREQRQRQHDTTIDDYDGTMDDYSFVKTIPQPI